MEQNTLIMGMLNLIPCPGFCVQNQKIILVNSSAKPYMVSVGTDIQELLLTGKEEYAAFHDGCLYLTLTLAGHALGFSVTRIGEFDIFLLEQDEKQPELQALALAARELRNPLTSIMSAADQLFPTNVPQEDADAREQASLLNRSVYQIHRLVNNMSHAQQYAGGLRNRDEVREIGSFLEELFCHAKDMTAYKNIRLTFENLSETVYTLLDAEMLERAVQNIISNAIKNTEAGGSITASLTRREHMLYLQIQDTGRGIPENIRGNIFSRFRREPSILEDGGIGLGMVLIHGTAAHHGGTVLVDQPEGSGTRVTMTLAIRQNSNTVVRSVLLRPDYAGERDHGLLEFSDCLPASAYDPYEIN